MLRELFFELNKVSDVIDSLLELAHKARRPGTDRYVSNRQFAGKEQVNSEPPKLFIHRRGAPLCSPAFMTSLRSRVIIGMSASGAASMSAIVLSGV